MLTFDPQSQCFLVDEKQLEFSKSDLNEMESLEWWHSIPFSPSVAPKAFCNPIAFIQHYQMDLVDFRGKSVLDIGCWDGFQAFYAESKGAKRVVGMDDCSQRHMGIRAREFAKRKLKSRVEFIDLNIYDLTPKYLGYFDIVMMFGVLYHLIHPMLGIERACSVCNERFLLASHYVDMPSIKIPLCFLYTNGELEDDRSNWTGPNLPWINKAIELQGFKPVHHHKYHQDRLLVHAEKCGTKCY